MSRTPLEPRDLRRTSEPIRGDRTERTTRRGATATQRPGRRRRLGWLWAILALLAAALIAALALGAFSSDDNAGQGAGGSMTAGGTSILPPPAGGLGDYVGQTATGKAVVVQSVVRKAKDNDTPEGFWVGSSKQDREYVEWGGTVGSNEADYTPKVGEKVNITGPVRPAPKNPQTTLKLSAADAALVRSNGGYVNADKVSPAQN